MFERAEKLGMTVERMSAEMPYAELVEWHALDAIRAGEREKAERQAKKGMKSRAGKRRR